MGIIRKKDFWLLLTQLAVWAMVISIPIFAALLSTQNLETTRKMGMMVTGMLFSPLILYFSNFYIFAPYLFFKKRFVWFVLVNVLLFIALNFGLYFGIRFSMWLPLDVRIYTYSGMFVYFLLNCATILLPVGIRQFIRVRRIKEQLEEEKAKSLEAELAWLKSQINPHFLFNTLNNISSLTQIDPDAAQDAIAQLSDLLRYAMYETQKPRVQLQGEVEFMKNYVELMRLRCNEKTTVTTHFDVPNHIEVAPLLFISLIENAFKHGVSNNKPSSIDISLVNEDDTLIFVCDNTNYPKDEKDRSGSGIGLENTQRRLELLYPGRYEWEQSLEGDIYHTKITIKL